MKPQVCTILVRSFLVRDVTDVAGVKLQVARAAARPDSFRGLGFRGFVRSGGSQILPKIKECTTSS